MTAEKRVVREKVQFPPGYTIAWSGQYEFMQRVWERLKIVVPLTLAERAFAGLEATTPSGHATGEGDDVGVGAKVGDALGTVGEGA